MSVHADGRVAAVHIDEGVFPGGRQLGPLLTRLLNGAREQAQAEVEDLVREAWADPRVTDVVAEIGDAPERSLPTAVGANPAPSPSPAHDYGRGDPADEDYSPLRPRSPIAADNDW
ncbi:MULTISPECIES: hypothetical protein [unclassified Nocardia]|uniref:hypothetical protein n=1 Tax=unclassified Nocardia TaxID=2637762 RepID=UPI00278C82FD|nr:MULTISPECIES: hypothetical protein [unclassified Nocardia]